MGVRITDSETVALYDSVSGFAFGPTFDDEEQAQDFCDWWHTYDDAVDLRRLTDRELEEAHSRWHRAAFEDHVYVGRKEGR